MVERKTMPRGRSCRSGRCAWVQDSCAGMARSLGRVLPIKRRGFVRTFRLTRVGRDYYNDGRSNNYLAVKRKLDRVSPLSCQGTELLSCCEVARRQKGIFVTSRNGAAAPTGLSGVALLGR